MKPKKYIAGLYFRLSQEDERQGESASIDNQRTMLRKYAEEHSFEIHDEYIDDGIWQAKAEQMQKAIGNSTISAMAKRNFITVAKNNKYEKIVWKKSC